jgi:hypothetical protein
MPSAAEVALHRSASRLRANTDRCETLTISGDVLSVHANGREGEAQCTSPWGRAPAIAGCLDLRGATRGSLGGDGQSCVGWRGRAVTVAFALFTFVVAYLAVGPDVLHCLENQPWVNKSRLVRSNELG